MRLRRLDLRHFRNLGVQELEFPPEGAAIVGDNAQGKSNLLEAIYYLETFRSFRGARDDQLVAFDRDVFRVVGVVEGDDDVEVAAAFRRSGRRKKVTVDGVECDRIGDGLGRLGAVIFSPADIAIITEGPSERRRFLDIVLSLNASDYLEALQRFRRILSQRNAALREEEPEAVVRAWDDALVRDGGTVIDARRRWIEGWAESFREHYRTLSGGRPARMEYRPSVEPGGCGEGPTGAVEAYHEALLDTADRERRAGNTVVGPHRDEVVFTLEDEDGELDVRDFGSGGQRRTAALALRLVEADTIRSTRGREPIVLMDDVFAELDPGRGRRILEHFDRDETGQVIVSAPKESDVKVRSDVLPRWRIRDGTVSP